MMYLHHKIPSATSQVVPCGKMQNSLVTLKKLGMFCMDEMIKRPSKLSIWHNLIDCTRNIVVQMHQRIHMQMGGEGNKSMKVCLVGDSMERFSYMRHGMLVEKWDLPT